MFLGYPKCWYCFPPYTHITNFILTLSYIIPKILENIFQVFSNLGINIKFITNSRVPKMRICFFLSSHPHIKFHYFSNINSIEFQNPIIDSLGSFQKDLKKDVEICDQFFGAWMYDFLIFLACTQQVLSLSILLHFSPEPWNTWLRFFSKQLKKQASDHPKVKVNSTALKV